MVCLQLVTDFLIRSLNPVTPSLDGRLFDGWDHVDLRIYHLCILASALWASVCPSVKWGD